VKDPSTVKSINTMRYGIHSSGYGNIVAALLLLTCLVGLAHCSKKGPAGRQYDSAVDFGTYHTFAFSKEGYRPPAWLEYAVEDSIMLSLESRGLELGQQANADLLLSYELSRKQRKVWTSSFNSRGVPTFRPDTFRREALLILTLSMRDPKTDKVVWTSYAALPPTNSREKTLAHLDEVVGRMLRQFPPLK